MKKTTIILFAMLGAASCFAAINDSISIIYPLMDIGVGPRALAMGEAYTAVADEASAVYWNPAGLSDVNSDEIGITYDKWFMDSFYSQLLAAMPMPEGVLGVDILYMNMGSVQGRDNSGNLTGQTLSPYNVEGSVGYGIKMGDMFSSGITLKLLSQSTGNLSSMGYAADIGLLFKTGIFSAGIDAQNIGSGSGYSLPMNIKAGAAIRPLDTKQNRLIIAADMQYLFHDVPSVSAGAEYVIGGIVALRAGYDMRLGQNTLDGLTGISGGIGLILENFSFDYAIVPYGDLGITNRLMLTYRFLSSAAPRQMSANEYYILGIKYEKEGYANNAIEAYNKSLDMDKKNATVWKKLGMLYYKAKDKTEAINCFENYLKLSPDDLKTKEWLKKYKK